MSSISSKNTSIELVVFRELRRKGICFQKHYSRIPGKPDIALPRKKLAIFIDGDFWHGYKFNQLRQRLPKEYWVEKIAGNIQRDRLNRLKLKKIGWRYLRIWEHDIKDDWSNTINRIIRFIAQA